MLEKKYPDLDTFYMKQALDLAQKAFDQNEVPIGALVVNQHGAIIGRGFNQVEGRKSQCAHAEMEAIEQATSHSGDWRLDGCTLYVTLEPCSMCYSLMRLCRIGKLVFGAPSPRFGYQLDKVATSSVYKKVIRVVSGVCSMHAQRLLKRFFQMQRMKKGEYIKSGSQEDQSGSY
jgi:tRNA(adenine34) deaminase